MTEENGLEKIYSDGYNELKNDLKERYTAKVYAALKDVRETLVNRASAIFGDEFFSLLNESLLLETEKEKARRDFFSARSTNGNEASVSPRNRLLMK